VRQRTTASNRSPSYSAPPTCPIGTVTGSSSSSDSSTRPTTACTATSSDFSPASSTVARTVIGAPTTGLSGTPEASTR